MARLMSEEQIGAPSRRDEREREEREIEEMQRSLRTTGDAY